MAFIAISLQIFWRKFFFWNVYWVVLYQPYTFCPNLSIWLVVMTTKRLNLQNKKKVNSSEAIWGIKLKFCRNAHSISFYKSIVFIAVAYALLVGMAHIQIGDSNSSSNQIRASRHEECSRNAWLSKTIIFYFSDLRNLPTLIFPKTEIKIKLLLLTWSFSCAKIKIKWFTSCIL